MDRQKFSRMMDLSERMYLWGSRRRNQCVAAVVEMDVYSAVAVGAITSIERHRSPPA